MGRAGRAGLRPARRLRALGRRVRRGDAEERDVSSLTGGSAETAAGEIPEIGIGMLGYAFMGKAHSNAFRKIAYMTWPPPHEPRHVGIAGGNTAGVEGEA